MNNRINELAIEAGGIWQGGYVDNQAGDGVWTEQKFVHGGDMDVEQFARLLVEESFRVALVEGKGYLDPVKLRNAMYKHFGVEL
jgi:hypothetical protein